MTKSELRRLKYAYIRNYTMDAKLANQGRDWSWFKIKDEIGLEKITERPRLKPIPKRVDTYLNRTESYREYLTKENKIERFRFAVKQTKNQRIETWKGWSRKDGKDLPDEFESLSQQINKKRGYDITDAYGFAVVHYAFTEDKGIQEVENLMARDKFDGDLYVYNQQKG